MKPYLIYTLPFTYHSAGAMVLQKLAKYLHDFYPNNVFVLSEKQDNFNIPLIKDCKINRRDCIAIYPEGVEGNPFNCEVVVRYLLNLPGTFGGPTSYPSTDLLFVYSDFFNLKMNLPKDRILTTPCINTNVFYDMKLKRIKKLYYVGKGKFYGNLEADNIGAGKDFEGIEGQKKLSIILNQCQLLYSFDSVTAMTEIARLCGCPVVIMPNDQWSKEDLKSSLNYDAGGLGYGLEDESYALISIDSDKMKQAHIEWERSFKKQLNNFIKITQSNNSKDKIIKATEGRRNKDCKVSVCTLTYNHKDLIKSALESFLMQKTNFPFEIIIYDDCSTDGTQNILKEYEKKDKRIKVFYGKINEFSKTGLYPFPTQLYLHAQGEYIAECDGDDYWTDPLKLQKQFNFMEQHPECIMCYHRFLLLDNNKFLEYPGQPEDYTREELISYTGKNYGIHTSTKFWRNIFNEKTRQDFLDFRADVPTTVMLGMHGECKFIEGISPSVFRHNHKSSSWTNLPAETMKRKTNDLWQHLYDLMVKKGNPIWINLRKPFLNKTSSNSNMQPAREIYSNNRGTVRHITTGVRVGITNKNNNPLLKNWR